MTELSSLVASSTMRRLGERFLPSKASFMSVSLDSDFTIFEIDEDHDFEFHGKKKVKRKVVVIKKSDEDGNETEEEIIINNGSAGNFDDQKVKVFPNTATNQITIQFHGNDKPFILFCILFNVSVAFSSFLPKNPKLIDF